MPSLRRLRGRLFTIFRKNRFDGEMNEELQFHLESITEQNIRNGLPEEEARRAALVCFGGLDKAKEECRDTRWMRIPEEFLQDLRYGLRLARRNPVFASVATIILALGIGANTAIISLFDAVVFRSLPVREPAGLVHINPSSLPDYEDIKADHRVFSGLAAFAGLPLAAHDADSRILSGRAVSANFFEVLGLTMAAGRGFLPGEDDIAAGRPVSVISYRYWQKEYGADPAAVGKSMSLNSELLTIVGVAPERFQDLFVGSRQDVWVPIPMFGKVMHVNQLPLWRDAMEGRDQPWLTLIGRLNDGVSLQQARARVEVLAENLRKSYPKSHGNWSPIVDSLDRVRWPDRDNLFPFAILLATSLCILLLICTNVANLLLAKGSARVREIAARIALGASRSRLVRQLMAEGFVLSAMATAASLAVCSLTMKFLPAFWGAGQSAQDLELAVDPRVMVSALCIGLLTTFLFALAPSLVASRTDVNSALKEQIGGGLIRTSPRFRRGLVTAQISLSVILLVVASLFVRTVLNFQATDLGYDRSVLLLKSDFLGWGGVEADGRVTKGIEFYRRSLERIRELPGVRYASWAEDLPFEPTHLEEEISPDQAGIGEEKWTGIECNSISSGYFKAVGIPVLQGRDFTDGDNESAARVVIVNETLARQFWPGESPIGKRLRVKGRNMDTGPFPTRSYEVIAMAKDVKYRSVTEKSKPYAYFHFAQGPVYFHMDLHVKAGGDPRTLIAPIRKACKEVNPKVAIQNARLMSDQLDMFLVQERTAASVFAVFGPLSLMLAAIGLYGIISYAAVQRAREFGIRTALGAQRKNILGMLLRDGMASTLMGLAIGLPVSLALAELIAGRLYGITPLDPPTYLSVSLLCIAISTAAVLLPARRACLKNPAKMLRNE